MENVQSIIEENKNKNLLLAEKGIKKTCVLSF